MEKRNPLQLESLADRFQQLGAVLLQPASALAARWEQVDAYVLDWDGVFNDGRKSAQMGSAFSEADAMGLNMLRFHHWRIKGQLPIVAIISGAHNPTALELAKRENLHGVYLGFTHKLEAFEAFRQHYQLGWSQLAFFFDDILDLAAAQHCQLALCAKRSASPLFEDWLLTQGWCHYRSAHEGGQHAVREMAELLMGLSGDYAVTIQERMAYSDLYQAYLATKKTVNTAEFWHGRQ